ncbi:MAG: GNAT family N-acetyltransferase [Pleurocapsa minor HA4230-MV1]|jgi:ribosomal protein S18 acetylase RimI-like enzyme|nr:GNAT family N-acetyltransferase [Pleurocapsa minor HA4230-MV1]
MNSSKIIPLEAKHKENAIEVIIAAFDGDPLMNLYFGNSYKRSIKALWQYIFDISPIQNSLLLGAMVRDELQGVIFASPPETEKNQDKSAIAHLKARLVEEIGKEAAEFFDLYFKLKSDRQPSQPHFYVNALGVHPRSQRMGIGSALLEHIHLLSDRHPESNCVALDTETEENVAYYQRLGYKVSSASNLDRVKIWFMFRE